MATEGRLSVCMRFGQPLEPIIENYQSVFETNIQRLRGFDVSVASTDEVLLPEFTQYMEY